MTLQQLKYFQTMATVLHYTEASRQLYVSQPTLSHALAELEKELEAPLFEKQGKTVVLTKFGTEFRRYVDDALNMIDQGVNRVRQMREAPNVVELGYIHSVSFQLLPHLVTGFCSLPAHTVVSFNLHQSMSASLVEGLKKQELHLAIAAKPHDPEIDAHLLLEQPLSLIISTAHPLAAQSRVRLEQLTDERFILPSPNSNLYTLTDGAFTSTGFQPRQRKFVEDCNAMAALVGMGFGVGIMAPLPSLEHYNVKVLQIEDMPLAQRIYLLWLKHQPLHPSARAFRDFVLAQQ